MKYRLSERLEQSLMRWDEHMERSKSIEQKWMEPEVEVDRELDGLMV